VSSGTDLLVVNDGNALDSPVLLELVVEIGLPGPQRQPEDSQAVRRFRPSNGSTGSTADASVEDEGSASSTRNAERRISVLDVLRSTATFVSTPGGGTVTASTISISPGRVVPRLFLGTVVLTSAGLTDVTVSTRVAVVAMRSGVFSIPGGCLRRQSESVHCVKRYRTTLVHAHAR
jgi:hypothetical protein